MCLAMCLKFLEFEAGCAYKLIAYEIKNVYCIKTSDGLSKNCEFDHPFKSTVLCNCINAICSNIQFDPFAVLTL